MLTKKLFFLSVVLFLLGLFEISDAFAACKNKDRVYRICEGDRICLCQDPPPAGGAFYYASMQADGTCPDPACSVVTADASGPAVPLLIITDFMIRNEPDSCDAGCLDGGITSVGPTASNDDKCAIGWQVRFCLTPRTEEGNKR